MVKGEAKMNRQDILIRNLNNLKKLNGIKSDSIMANKIGIDKGTWCKIMHGKTLPPLKTMFHICDVFNVSMGDLFDPDAKQYGEAYVNGEFDNKDELIKHLSEKLSVANLTIADLTEQNEQLTKDIDRYEMERDANTYEPQTDGRTKLVIVDERNMILRKDNVDIELHDKDFNEMIIEFDTDKKRFTVEATVEVDDIVNNAE